MVKIIICVCLIAFSNFVSLNVEAKQKPNIIFVLTDDQRYDEIGFMNPILQTPNMDKLAQEGVHFQNAFVTTSLCSPSRASILTGLYMHNHGVVDNNKPPREGTQYFPELMQEKGYDTAFIGKWHMGEHLSAGRKLDDPQPGFDHWVSFAGQGQYYPVDWRGQKGMLNINGESVPQTGYITDELTDYAMEWLESRKARKPFFMYLSHKAVHADFIPAKRHEKQFEDASVSLPSSYADTQENYVGKPMWVKNQRNSWHGVDFAYHKSIDIKDHKMRYHRTLSAVDESLGRILQWLKDNNLDKNTLVMLMGDNGFMFGEHGLIDKRNAYEESMRVPLLAWGADVKKQHQAKEIVANIDIAATLLDAAGIKAPKNYDGRSFYPIAKGKEIKSWRSDLLYEYYWEFNFPSTPTTFALRTDKYKFIMYHGIWDTEELYDLENDPKEMYNLIAEPQLLATVADLREKLFAKLKSSPHGNTVPFTEKFSSGAVFRHSERSKAATFPERWLKQGNESDLWEFFTPDKIRAKNSKKQQKE